MVPPTLCSGSNGATTSPTRSRLQYAGPQTTPHHGQYHTTSCACRLQPVGSSGVRARPRTWPQRGSSVTRPVYRSRNSRRGLRASVEPPRRAENADMEVESRERTDGGPLQSTLDAMARMSASAQAHGRDLAARAASGEGWPRGDFASRGNSGHVVGTSVEHSHHAEHAGMVEESRERVDREALRAYNVSVIRRAARDRARATSDQRKAARNHCSV